MWAAFGGQRMAMFEVKMEDGSRRLFNPDWISMVSAAPEGGTLLELAVREPGEIRIFRTVEDYETVKNRIQIAQRESAGHR
jgi:hypothetical protein